MIEVPGVTGVVGVGWCCTQLCCSTPVRGSEAAFEGTAVVKVRLEEEGVVVEVMMSWLVADVDVDNCTGG